MTTEARPLYSARLLTEGHDAGKWAVFKGDEQRTKGRSKKSARSWANFMNRMAAKGQRA